MMLARRAMIGGDRRTTILYCWRLRFCWILRIAVMVVSGINLGWTTPLFAQDTIAQREAKVKAAYIYKFINYVKWPQESFPDEESPLVIGSVGDDLVNRYLRVIANRRTAGDRPLVYHPDIEPAQAKSCHILFVSGSVEKATFEAIMMNIRDEPVLLVGEWGGFAKSGGVIGFIFVENHIRLQLSMEAASRRGLTISSQLAKLAQLVD